MIELNNNEIQSISGAMDVSTGFGGLGVVAGAAALAVAAPVVAGGILGGVIVLSAIDIYNNWM